MAREYGKVMTSAWVDKEFTSLTRRAQGTYFFLISQPDLNRAGVLTMALNRWASRSGEKDRALILEDLAELARTGFIVVDENDEEVLVRSYVRNDDGWKSPNIMLAVAAAAKQVTSETLRSVIRDELRRIDTSSLSVRVNEKTGRSTREFVESVIGGCVKALANASPNPSVLAWGTSREPFGEPFTEPFSEGSLTTTTPEPSPEPEPEPEPETTPAQTALARREPDGFDAFWAAYPKRQDKGHARTAWAKAVRKADGELITNAAVRFASDPNLPEPQFIPLAATWLNGERWEDGPLSPRSKTGTTDKQAEILRAEMDRARIADAQQPRLEIAR